MGRQNRALLSWLESHDEGITTLEAMERLRICRLSERIRELEKVGEKLGFLIEHERDASLNAHFVRYRLLRVAYG